jgi:hypothetical protein
VLINSDAYYAVSGTHAGFVVVGHDATGIAPSSASPSHAPDTARYGAELINTP